MPEWLLDPGPGTAVLTVRDLAFRLIVSMLLGFVVATIYCGSQRRRPSERLALVTTLVLLTILVAMTTLVIGNSVARAFSLVGALSIVRFRTVVEDTRDTAFVIFAVVVGMAVGAGHLDVALIGIPVVAGTVGCLAFFERPGRGFGIGSLERRLEVRVGSGYDPETLLGDVLRNYTTANRLTAAITARQGVALDLHYAVKMTNPPQPLALVKALNSIEGVQQVELREPT